MHHTDRRTASQHKHGIESGNQQNGVRIMPYPTQTDAALHPVIGDDVEQQGGWKNDSEKKNKTPIDIRLADVGKHIAKRLQLTELNS